MSNVTFVFPNRAREYQKLHRVNWTDNANLPIENLLTEVLPETARTTDFALYSDKRASIAISLPAVPYRTIGAIALANHNLSLSAKIRVSVFNEPAICYVNQAMTISTGTKTFTIPTADAPPGSLIGKTLKLFGVNNVSTETKTGEFVSGNVTAHDGSGVITLNVTSVSGSGSYNYWYVGNSTNKEIEIVNQPAWLQAWQRVFQTSSDEVQFRSRNFWRGTVEEEQREEYTHLRVIPIYKKNSTEQAVGTHVHIDIDDSSTPDFYGGVPNASYQPFIEIGYLMFGQCWTSTNNPEYGSVKHGYEDPSEKQESDSGQEFWHEKQKRRTVNIGFNLLDKNEAFGKVYEMQRQQGLSRPVIYLFSKGENIDGVDFVDKYHFAQSFIGRLTDLSPIGQPHFGYYDANINIKEML